MSYASDIYLVLKTADYMRLKDHPAIKAPDTVSFGDHEGISYTMIFINEIHWYGEWNISARAARKPEHREFILDQESFMDEVKKFDFYDFVRTGETADDMEEYHSGSENLLWAEPVQGGFPFVTFEADVFQPD